MVKIQTSTEITPKIYAYTTPTVTENEGWIKIGYTERDVETRIKEQTHTVSVQTKVLWSQDAKYTKEPQLGHVFKDHDFHHFLKFHDVMRRPKTEWFYFNGQPERAYHLFSQFITHDTSGFQPGKGDSYILRAEQEEAVAKTLSYAKAHPNGKFLWNAKPRFGKTLTTYDFVRQMDAKSVLIVTNRPAIANSWFDDFDRFIAGQTEYKFVSESESLKHRPTMTRQEYIDYVTQQDDDSEPRHIAFISLQDLKGSIFMGGAHNKLKWVTQLHWDVLVIDEAHEGVDTLKTDVAFEQIKRSFTLHLSGTPFKAMSKGDFTEDEIYNWSYADEQRAKKKWINADRNPYENLPQLNMFTYQMSKMIGEQLEGGVSLDGGNVDYAFDLNEFFATKDDGKFLHESAVKAWLETLTANEKYPFSTKELRQELKHTFWLLNRVASAKALKKLLEDHPVFEQYKVILAAGDGKEEAEQKSLQAIDAVKQAIAKYDKTITLSVGQLTTGVTIPQWSAVLMLSNIKSPALYMQAAFRAQNPYEWQDEQGNCYRKENAYVFDFAPERTLVIFDEFANNLSLSTAMGGGTTTQREDNIVELLNFFPVIAEDSEGKMVEIDAKELLVIPRKIKAQEVLKRGFMSNLLFDNIAGIFQATQTVLDILEDLPVEKEGKVTQSNSLFDLSEVTVDDQGNPSVPHEIVVNQQMRLFGDKVYGLSSAIEKTLEDMKENSLAQVVAQVNDTVAEVILEELHGEYHLQSREYKNLQKQIKEDIQSVVHVNEVQRKIVEATIKDEFEMLLTHVETKEEKETVQRELEERIQQNTIDYHEKLTQTLKNTVSEMSEKYIVAVEQKRVKQLHQTKQDEIRAHLRGFARTIPSFIMAYGDKNLTLDNFDTYIPDDIFKEVTGITLAQFRYLRDGGEGFSGRLFDRSTFDEAIQEFLRKKEELSNYFDNPKEDIFDYIPPQKTNQIFTPKVVVKKMVDELEVENPGIFDDDSKTFIDLYMKSGLYIAEIVKRLYNSSVLQMKYPDDTKRLKHILENQVFGFAPSPIIYNIATNFIFGQLSENISRDNFVMCDTVPYAKSGTIQKLIDVHFEKNSK